MGCGSIDGLHGIYVSASFSPKGANVANNDTMSPILYIDYIDVCVTTISGESDNNVGNVGLMLK